jgi:hypothetical protein
MKKMVLRCEEWEDGGADQGKSKRKRGKVGNGGQGVVPGDGDGGGDDSSELQGRNGKKRFGVLENLS